MVTYRPVPVRRLKTKQDREREAVRLTVWMMAGLLRTGIFHLENRPFGDAWSSLEWLRGQVKLLTRDAVLLREIAAVIDPERSVADWAYPVRAKRMLRRMGARARRPLRPP